MMPDDGRVHLVNGENGFDRTVSVEAAGIVLTMWAIKRRGWVYRDCKNSALARGARSTVVGVHRVSPRMSSYLRCVGVNGIKKQGENPALRLALG